MFTFDDVICQLTSECENDLESIIGDLKRHLDFGTPDITDADVFLRLADRLRDVATLLDAVVICAAKD